MIKIAETFGGSKELIRFFLENQYDYTSYENGHDLYTNLMNPTKKWIIIYYEDDEVLEFRCGENKVDFSGIEYTDLYYRDVYGLKSLINVKF